MLNTYLQTIRVLSMDIKENWSSKIGFILTAIGSALGLGAMWKLPYVIGQNGGSAFLLWFIIFNFVIGLPLFIGELVLGRYSSKAIVSSFLVNKQASSSWSIVGWLTVLVSLLILAWYTVVAGWSIAYIIISLSDAFIGLSKEEVSFRFDLFRESLGLNFTFQIMFIALNMLVLAKGVSSGIEKWSKFMTSALFIMLLGLALYACFLPGFDDGLHYILYPDFSKITSKGILQALSLALFTLSLAYGVMITYGSYLKKEDDIPKTAFIVLIANLIASILIAITIFPMIFSFGFEPQAGEGLIFKTLPYVFEQLPFSMLLSIAFFTLLLFAALTSSISMFEVIVANFMDLLKISRIKSLFISCIIVVIIGLPNAFMGKNGLFPNWDNIFNQTFMQTNTDIVDWLLVIIALFTTIFIAFIVDKKDLRKEFISGSKFEFLYGLWLILMKTLVPCAIIIVILERFGIISL